MRLSPIIGAFAMRISLSRPLDRIALAARHRLRAAVLKVRVTRAWRTSSKRVWKAAATRVTGVRSRTVETEVKARGCFGQGLLAC